MVSQTDFPSEWVQDCPGAGVRVEIRMDDTAERHIGLVTEDPTWIEIPTSSVELWETETNKKRLKRSARVEFPTEWGTEGPNTRTTSPREILDGYQTGDERLQHARVSLEHPSGEYVLKHMGWISGVGGTNEEGLSKLWIYDYLELVDHVPAGHPFNHPTVSSAVSKIAQLTNDNAPIPLASVAIFPPETEEEKATIIERAQDSLIDPRSSDFVIPGSNNGAYYTDVNVSGDVNEIGETYLAANIDTGTTLPIPLKNLTSKVFKSNHDTLLDIYNWFEERTGARLHFEPHNGGDAVVLIADVEPEQRVFADTNVLEKFNSGLLDPTRLPQNMLRVDPREFHEAVVVIENDALFQIKPVNTVYVRGDVGEGFKPAAAAIDVAALGQTGTFLEPVLGTASYLLRNSQPPSKKFPTIKAQMPALIQAAEGHVLAPPVIESDATTLDAAKQEAVDALQKHLKGTSEGKITMAGTPKMTANDVIDAFEQCGDTVIFEQRPVRYKIDEVKHTKKANEPYITEARVGVWTDESRIQVSKTMEKMEE